MGVSCKRVGCRVPATTSLVIDPGSCTVTLVDVEQLPVGVTLCSVHASGVSAPLRWTLADARAGDLRLLAVDAVEDTDGPDDARPPRARGGGADEGEQEAFPWHHHFADDQPQSLTASSPLLARAFRTAV